MTNRPLDYEHPFARLVPDDIVTPTREVVKEEEEVRFGRVEIVKFIETDPKTLEQAMDKIAADFVAEECDRIEQEHQTGWRFLGGAEQSSYVINDCAGTFTIGKIYQIEHTGLTDPTFIDDNNEIMHEELKYFEEVK